MPTSQVIEQEKKDLERKVHQYSAEEKEQQRIWFDRMETSWQNMNTSLEELDGLTLIEACREYRLARNSFLTPIMNDGEVRVVTGTTEGKVDSVFNAVYNQNIEAEVQAYNEFDIEDVMLGDSLTKVIKRTDQMENSDDIESSILDEILTMPACFVQEVMSDEWYYDRKLTKGDWEDLWQFKPVTFSKSVWMRKREPRKVLWSADQVLLADIKIPARLFHTQPYTIKYRIRTKEEARRVYQNSPRWQFVMGGMPLKQEVKGNITTSDWRFSRRIKNDEVEEIIAESICDDEQQIWLNGVPMLPVGCPYLANRFQKANMTMEIHKEINRNFAYGRPPVAMAKTLQALKDEDFRLMVIRRRQEIFQPIVTKAQTILSKDMWLPASITYGVSKSEIESLIDNQRGVDNSMQEMIKEEIEGFLNVSAIFQGADQPNTTAYQAAQQMKQALIMLGNALVARMRAKRNCTYMRLYNILQNFLDPIDTRYNDHLGKSEEIYRTYSLRDTDLYDGAVGTQIISFINRQLLPQEQDKILQIEKESRAKGKPVAYSFLPVDDLKNVPRLFHVNIMATEKRNSLIEKEMFKKDIIDSMDLGQRLGIPVNPGYATQEWGKRVKIDANKLYMVPQAPELGGGGVIPGMGGGKGAGGAPMGKGGPAGGQMDNAMAMK